MRENCLNKINVCCTPLTADAYMSLDRLPDWSSMSIMPKQVPVTSSRTEYVEVMLTKFSS